MSIREWDLDEAAMAEWVTRDDGRIHLVSMVGRLGAGALIAALEWNYFVPGTTESDLFDIRWLRWRGHGFLVTSLPSGRLDDARRLAKQLGVRLARGLPALFTSKGVSIVVTSSPSRLQKLGIPAKPSAFFPGIMLPNGRENDRTYVIENDTSSPVYRNVQQDYEAMASAELEIIQTLNRGVKLSPEQIADYIYGSGPFPDPAHQGIV